MHSRRSPIILPTSAFSPWQQPSIWGLYLHFSILMHRASPPTLLGPQKTICKTCGTRSTLSTHWIQILQDFSSRIQLNIRKGHTFTINHSHIPAYLLYGLYIGCFPSKILWKILPPYRTQCSLYLTILHR